MSTGAAIRPMNARPASILLRLVESSASGQRTLRVVFWTRAVWTAGKPSGCWRRSARCATHSKATILFRKIRNTDPVLIGFASVATTETREASYRARDGNDGLDGFGRKSLRHKQFPITRDPSEPASPGRVRPAFA